MPNTINLRLLDNKNIIAELNGIPLAQENSYKIIEGEENATIFKIASKPEQYKNANYTVEMVNSQGYGIAETEIVKDTFILPAGMAVAGYGLVQIRAYLSEEVVPFMPLKVKVWNTLPNWKEEIPENNPNSNIVVDSELSNTSTNPVQNKVIKKYVDDNTTKLFKHTFNVDMEQTTVDYDTLEIITTSGEQSIIESAGIQLKGEVISLKASDMGLYDGYPQFSAYRNGEYMVITEVSRSLMEFYVLGMTETIEAIGSNGTSVITLPQAESLEF